MCFPDHIKISILDEWKDGDYSSSLNEYRIRLNWGNYSIKKHNIVLMLGSIIVQYLVDYQFDHPLYDDIEVPVFCFQGKNFILDTASPDLYFHILYT